MKESVGINSMQSLRLDPPSHARSYTQRQGELSKIAYPGRGAHERLHS